MNHFTVREPQPRSASAYAGGLLLAAAAVVAAGAVSVDRATAQEDGGINLVVENRQDARGLEGPALKEFLHRNLFVRGFDRPMRVQLVAVRVKNRRPGRRFVSKPFEAAPGPLFVEQILPNTKLPPSEMFQACCTGETLSTGPVEFPGRRLEEFAARTAVEAAQRTRTANGMFIVVVGADPRARRQFPSSGLMVR